jgi:hypothetical protein
MTRSMLAAALVLYTVLPAAAQDHGGVRLRGSDAVLGQVENASQSGCRLSQTNVTVGVNRALGVGSQARQQLGADGSSGCRPLVSTQVTTGVNLALGSRSSAQQSIDATGPQGLLTTTNLARGVNIAAGSHSSAGQRILSQTRR